MPLIHATNPDLTIEAGTVLRREEINARFGGGIQGGMLTPAGGKLILLYSDPAVGERNGYNFDGWEDDSHSVYYYTGEGQVGPQEMIRRNRVLLSSQTDGREVHVFVAVGTAPGSAAKLQEYIGQFELDADHPVRTEVAADREKDARSVFVFKLRRIGTGVKPTNPLASVTVPKPPTQSGATEVPREAANAAHFTRAAVDPGIAFRRERDLESGLIDWLEAHGKVVSRLKITVAQQTAPLFTDTWVASDLELFEVKGNATRDDVRMAIAQLLDYRRHITPPPKRLTVALPAHPGADLADLIESVGLELAVFSGGTLARFSQG